LVLAQTGWHVRGRSAFADNDIDFAILGEPTNHCYGQQRYFVVRRKFAPLMQVDPPCRSVSYDALQLGLMVLPSLASHLAHHASFVADCRYKQALSAATIGRAPSLVADLLVVAEKERRADRRYAIASRFRHLHRSTGFPVIYGSTNCPPGGKFSILYEVPLRSPVVWFWYHAPGGSSPRIAKSISLSAAFCD
jgi:hypothetical protein